VLVIDGWRLGAHIVRLGQPVRGRQRS
jgi:hypothetical protein